MIALIGGMYALSQRHDERIGNIKERADERFEDHDTRIKGADDKIAQLPDKYVTRTELEARLKSIEENTAESKKMLNWLILFGKRQAGMTVPQPSDMPDF